MSRATAAVIALSLAMACISSPFASGDCEFRSGRICPEGTTCYDDEGCNRCTCTNDGLACTVMGCQFALKPGTCERETPDECTLMPSDQHVGCHDHGEATTLELKYCPSSTSCPNRSCLVRNTIPGEAGVFWCCP